MCHICKNQYGEFPQLYIIDCSNIKIIPVIPRLDDLFICNCSLLTSISIIPELTKLYIAACPKFVTIPLYKD